MHRVNYKKPRSSPEEHLLRTPALINVAMNVKQEHHLPQPVLIRHLLLFQYEFLTDMTARYAALLLGLM